MNIIVQHEYDGYDQIKLNWTELNWIELNWIIPWQIVNIIVEHIFDGFRRESLVGVESRGGDWRFGTAESSVTAFILFWGILSEFPRIEPEQYKIRHADSGSVNVR